MSGIITEHSLFKPKPSKAETKADITDQAARTIIETEAARREAKTAKLRLARVEAEKAEAELAASAAPNKSRRAKTSARRGTSPTN